MRDTGPILVVEDDPEAAELLRIAFQKAGLRRPLRVLPDGEKAVAYLSGDPPYDNSPAGRAWKCCRGCGRGSTRAPFPS